MSTSPKRPRTIRRRVSLGLGLTATVCASYLLLLIYPQPLFAHRRTHREFVIYSDAPIPDAIDPLIDRVEARLARSPLFDHDRTYHVFLCQSTRLFALLANTNWRVAGVLPVVGRNVFLRTPRIERDRLVGPSGREADGDRTLTYFIAHELTHAMTVDSLGRVRYFLLPRWVREGYADFVAKERFDVAAALVDWRAGAQRMDPAASGLYDRFHLMVARALGRDGATVQGLLRDPPSEAELERQLRQPDPRQP